MSHRVGAFLLYHEALLHDQHSSFAECINAFFSLALIISYAYAYDRPAADTLSLIHIYGTITMFLRHENDSVQFILEDEGPGIADDAKARIFDKFYQVDGSHKAEGNGLGLALVKRIVDIAGGTIKAENREYGGCRFVVELPIKN